MEIFLSWFYAPEYFDACTKCNSPNSTVSTNSWRPKLVNPCYEWPCCTDFTSNACNQYRPASLKLPHISSGLDLACVLLSQLFPQHCYPVPPALAPGQAEPGRVPAFAIWIVLWIFMLPVRLNQINKSGYKILKSWLLKFHKLRPESYYCHEMF